MRLSFTTPSGWIDERAGDRVGLTRRGGGVEVQALPVQTRWGFDPLAILEKNRPPGTTLRFVQVTGNLRTADGWPLRLLTYQAARPDGTMAEAGIAALYEFRYYVGLAVGRARSADALETERPTILEILTGARPHLWPDEPVCVAELWSMEEP